MKEFFPSLEKIHSLKEEIRNIFDRVDNSEASLLKLTDWLLYDRQYFPKNYQTITLWLPEIIAYFDRRTTNGVVEGINKKIKLIKCTG